MIERTSFCRITVVLLGFLAAGCSVAPLSEPIDDIADRLVRSLEERKDPRSLKVLVYEIHEASASNSHAGRHVAEAGHVSEIGSILEHEFVVALAPRLNIVESEHADGQATFPENALLWQLAEWYGANAVLAGDYVDRNGELHITVRIVDTKTMLVVAAATGVVQRSALGRAAEHDAREAGGAPQHGPQDQHEP